jgi:hypothetical protein
VIRWAARLDAVTAAVTAKRQAARAPWASAQAWLGHVWQLLVAHESYIVAVAALAGVGAGLIVAVRQRNGSRVTAARVRVVLVPTDTFDPNLEQIVGFARVLSQSRTPRPLLTPPWCRCVRFKWFFTVSGELVFSVEVPPWMLSALRAAVYDLVDLQPMSVLDELVPLAPGGAVTVAAAGADSADSVESDPSGEEDPSFGDAAGVDNDVATDGEDLNELVVVP